MSAIDQPRLLQDKGKELHRVLRQRRMLHEIKVAFGVDLLGKEPNNARIPRLSNHRYAQHHSGFLRQEEA